MRTDLLLLGEFFNISSLAFFEVKCLHIKQWGWIIIDNKWNAISSQANNLSIFPNQNTGSHVMEPGEKKILNINQSNISGRKRGFDVGYF